ncbi:PREDICTED: cryptochrome-2-like isoform X1 [Gavialis gangeticus]|uniref:cryptochrome-2-like isoform X1 n=1 Tax=Gavialis gangeticus TaxID=94835 RepID=UPI00092FC6F4|nr:PREDICTED: cryptochrome-2-like isoform X1 [Gavialis gangeticus]XP_019364524.1 PREDICTED: cryptochrome-2-like isoform X1 [Gavialis gangeticus]
MKHSCIHWFRKGLRLHDNPALLAAMNDCSDLYPIFILDPWFPKNMQVSVNRWRFLIESLKDLDESLKKLNSRLFVVRGHPAEVFPGLFKAWKVTRLTFEVDTEPYSKLRDAEVVRLAAAHGVQVIQKVSHTLYDTDRIIAENNGKVPLTYRQLQAVLVGLGSPKQPVLAPTLETLKDCCTPGRDNHDPKYEIPTLEELGQDPKEAGPCLYPGGESEALSRLDFHMKRMTWVCNFKKPDTEPNTLSPSTTVLSPYIKFGCLSVRTFWWKLAEIYRGKTHSSPPVSLHGQLLWREFFYTAGAGIPNFNRMEGNPICVQVDWDDNPEYVKAWKEGRTGYPFIDAIMTQLRTEGWIHHLARHAVACFLTRGDLWVSWEEGQKVFEELLLDADWSLNAGNWQWLSASAFFHQFFRVYSPVAFGKKTDKSGAYIKKYLPILRKFPAEYIYEPWKAPRSMQEQAGCIIGRDYPRPIVEHEAVSKRNIMRMKAAYAQRSHSKAAQVEKEGTKKGGKRKLPAGPSVVELLTKKPKAKSS